MVESNVVAVATGTDEVLCRIENRVATVTLNRPEKRNALGDTLTPALRAILLVLEADPRVRCVVITGAGDAFCAGGDISGMGKGLMDPDAGPPPTVEEKIRTLQHRTETLTMRLHELPKPTIAVLPGPAAGAGLSIALACDIRIMADNTFVTTAFGNIGLSGDYGGSWFLTHLVGTAKARELFFTSARVSSEECLRLGIANAIVPRSELEAYAEQLAGQIASGPPVALRYMKENLNRAMIGDLKSCLAMESDRTVRSAQTDDHSIAVKAFLGKEAPVFTGH